MGWGISEGQRWNKSTVRIQGANPPGSEAFLLIMLWMFSLNKRMLRTILDEFIQVSTFSMVYPSKASPW
jgi:hypothetical protein